LYHVFNRGNYRHDVFETVGAAQAFEATLTEACVRHDWRIHAYAIMCNHYHLALETVGANLVQGMQWLQGTFAARFNRYRAMHGHLFQGRYQALLVENTSALLRVVHYIHLNPVRAAIVQPAAVVSFRWGSLRRLVSGTRPPWLISDALRRDLNIEDTTLGWRGYLEFLAALADDSKKQQEMGFDQMCSGWAIGTAGWRQTLAREYSAMALEVGFEQEELREIRETRWRDALHRLLRERGDSIAEADLHAEPLSRKIEVAAQLRQQVGAPYRWIADALQVDRPASLRMQVRRHTLHVSP
jgi:REP element-mobilizing transposase RayT